jgi:hypothetical protein
LVKQTGAPQLITGGATESNEESTLSPGPSDPLWMEIATAEAGHLAEGKRMGYLQEKMRQIEDRRVREEVERAERQRLAKLVLRRSQMGWEAN